MRWLRRLFGKSRAENELDRELRFHLEQQVSENLAGGMPARMFSSISISRWDLTSWSRSASTR